MKYQSLLILPVALLAILAPQARATVMLGTAGDYVALAGSAVASGLGTVVGGGNIGTYPGGAIAFPPGILLPPGVLHAGDPFAQQAQLDLLSAYNFAAGLPVNVVLTGQDLGGLTLTPGVYFFSSSAQLTGVLTLDNQNDPTAEFVFQIGSTLTTANNAAVVSINNGGNTDPGRSVFWQVGSSATIGVGSAVQGHIMALASITMNTGASLTTGSLLAINGGVTFDQNTATNAVIPVPEPATMSLLLIGGVVAGYRRIRRARK